MTKDEIIVLLKEQLQLANDTVSSLTIQVGELIERIKSLEEQLVLKGIPSLLITSFAVIIRMILKLWCKGTNKRECYNGINAEPLTSEQALGINRTSDGH